MAYMTRWRGLALASLSLLAFGAVPAAADECEGFGDFAYLCGPKSAEDLVLIPNTQWVIASGFGEGAPLYLVDAKRKTWQAAVPNVPESRDADSVAACPVELDVEQFVAHGLHLRTTGDDQSTLYVVGHGGREAIEIFAVDARGQVPQVSWVGCVMLPDGMAANSVTSAPDGSLVASIPLHPGFSIEDIFREEKSGAVYRWSPGDSTFAKLAGTEMGYANGVELSENGETVFVASSAHLKVFAFTNTNPARLIGETPRLDFVPDNLHMSADGKLLTAGLIANDPTCGDVSAKDFDLAAFASCHRGFTVLAIDPDTLETDIRASSPAQPHFSNVTMALEVAGELWIGTFAGDRIAYLQMGSGDD